MPVPVPRGDPGGDASGDLVPLLLDTADPYFTVAALVLIALAYLLAYWQGARKYRRRCIQRGKKALADNLRQHALEKLRQRDPDFDEEAFVERVRLAFFKVQDAISAQDPEAVRAFVSDGLFTRLSLQGEEQKALGYRSRVDDVCVHEAIIVELQPDVHFDALTVRIRASARQRLVSLEGGQPLRRQRSAPAEFTEYWGFLRRRGSRTRARHGLIEGHCPNCASSIRMNQTARCSSCASLLRSGEYDWVLAEITQRCDWKGTGQSGIPGVRPLQERDPEFNLQHLEDRASVVFWRRLQADRTGSMRPLRSVAHARFLDAYERKLLSSSSPREYFGECSVGAVDTLAVLAGSDWDRALVQISWSGTLFQVFADQPPRRTPRRSYRRTLLLLGRRSGVLSELSRSICSSHCPSCGAPELGLGGQACAYCATVLNGGEHGWVLLEQPAFHGEKARHLLEKAREATETQVKEREAAERSRLADVPPTEGLLAWLIGVVVADGKVDESEQRRLEALATTCDVSGPRLEAMIEAAQGGELETPEPQDSLEARRWLEEMTDLALVDGFMDRREGLVLRKLGIHYGLTEFDLRRMFRSREKELCRRARRQVRRRRGRSTAAK